MPDLLAKGVAVTVGVLLAIVVGILVVTSRPPAGATEVTAEFDNAFPLIEGMYVRVDGAIAGSVGTIEVNDRGNADVELILNDSIEPPSSDATAAIRQQDTTGDSYVAFDPGDSGKPLGPDGIVCQSYDECDSTLVAPRLDDLLNSFGPGQRAGIKLILVETAKALDERGIDLNRAALELKPALEQANVALAQVNSQNDALKQLLASAENVTGQAARHNDQLGDLIGSLAATLDTVQDQSAPLDESLAKLPATTTQARTTLAKLTAAATAAQPLADSTAKGAPLLASALDRFPGFLDNASSFLSDTRSTLELTKNLLHVAQPTLEIGKKRVVTGSFDLVGATADLLNSVLGGEDAFPALFGDDSYGEGEGTLGKRGFGAVAVEPGDLPGYPASHAPRNWLRVSAVINCEVFGVPVHPGCLAEALSSLRAKQKTTVAKDKQKRADALAEAATAVRDANPLAPSPPDRPDTGNTGDGSGDSGNDGSGDDGSGGGIRDIPDVPGLGGGSGKGPLGKLGDAIGGLGLLPRSGGGSGAGPLDRAALKQLRKRGLAQTPGTSSYRDLMEFLLSDG
jgi:virulence factor Mce-like protein